MKFEQDPEFSDLPVDPDSPDPILEFDDDEDQWQEEGLFARDSDGHLLRMDEATRDELDTIITVCIDGRDVEVPKAVPRTDSQGNLLRDDDGLVIPRPTTIYDAVNMAYSQQSMEISAVGQSQEFSISGISQELSISGISREIDLSAATGEFELNPLGQNDALGRMFSQISMQNPVPILCHREHQEPAAVCRVCVVQVAKFKARTGRVTVERKLLPACQHRVEETMIVDTMGSRDEKARIRITRSVRTLLEMLLADHPQPCEKERQNPGECELEALGRRFRIRENRFSPSQLPEQKLQVDLSSLVFAVDHNACILCDRCIRGCNEVRNNHILGRSGKGLDTTIAFDLADPMGESGCIACGECMISCPTGALTYKAQVGTELVGDPVDPASLQKHKIREIRKAFSGVSAPFLRWNSGAIVRRKFRDGEIICHEGEFGSTAFLIEEGEVEIFLKSPVKSLANRPESGLWNRIRQVFNTDLFSSTDPSMIGRSIHVDAPESLDLNNPRAKLRQGDLFGEMTCMNNYPRSATVKAVGDVVVLEMLRNVLYVLQRNPDFRNRLQKTYRERAIENHLRNVPLFDSIRSRPELFQKFVDQLRHEVVLRRVSPGEVIFRQGAPASDGLYLVRTGFVKVSQKQAGSDSEVVVNYIGPGGYFGEIGLLADLPELRDLQISAYRTATCTALDHVELVRLSREDLQRVCDEYPEVLEELVRETRKRVSSNTQIQKELASKTLNRFLEQGLQEAQSLLVLDLTRCTRCDDCTRACADTHGGVTRLIREGLRFDRFLIASSCRSCLDPYCMVGCPVGSIRRRDTREIVIEDWCIGCSLCSQNCPYGNINMVEIPERTGSGRKATVQTTSKATTCDLCQSLGPGSVPSCVYACPHDAAHRMTGVDLLELVKNQTNLPEMEPF
jgi:CRP-like cAMP-binding protein/Fe-S-cluster-containing dehydrogenase component